MYTNLGDNIDPAIAWASGITGVIILAIAAVVLILVLWALISALIDGDTSAGGKLLWIIFILWAPLLGAVAWLVVGKKGHLNRLLGIDKGRARHSVPTSVGQHSNVASARPARSAEGGQVGQAGHGQGGQGGQGGPSAGQGPGPEGGQRGPSTGPIPRMQTAQSGWTTHPTHPAHLTHPVPPIQSSWPGRLVQSPQHDQNGLGSA